MEPPAVQYVTTRDGYSIAYTVCGEGPPFVVLPGWSNHARGIWKSRADSGLMEDLTRRHLVVNFDARGMGMSTRSLPEDLSLDTYLSDLEAVLDRRSITRFVLLGSHSSALWAAHFAARNPNRVEALVLMNSGPRWLGLDLPSYWDDLPRESWDTFLYALAPKSLSAEVVAAWADTNRRWITQTEYLAAATVWRSASLDEVLPRICMPALVLKPQECPCTPLESAAELARGLPNGRLVLFDSDLAFGAPGQAVRIIEDFLDSVLAPPQHVDHFVPPSGLSPRQLQVLRLIAEGKTNGEIADELVISLRTVERHVADVYSRLGARNRVEAAAFALHQLAKS